MRKRYLAFLLLLALAACTLRQAEVAPYPTPMPTGYLPTAIALTARALASPTAASTPTTTLPTSTPPPVGTPTATAYPLRWPTLTPTLPPTPEISGSPYAILQILYPGMGSRVTSPLKTIMAVQVDYVDAFRVELLGEDGRLLYRRVFRLSDEERPERGLLSVNLEIPFEIRGEAEMGRLQMVAEDALGRPLFQNAIPLTLLKRGQAQISYRTAERSPILFAHPALFETIKGGHLQVSGQALRVSDAVEIFAVNNKGKVVLYHTAPLSTAGADGYAAFSADIPYAFTKPVRVRLVVRENGITPPGVMYLNSRMVTLNP